MKRRWIPITCATATIVGLSGTVYTAHAEGTQIGSDCTTITTNLTGYPVGNHIQEYLNGALMEDVAFDDTHFFTMSWVGDERPRGQSENYRVVIDSPDDSLDLDITLTRLPMCSAIVQGRLNKPKPPGGRVHRESPWLTTTTTTVEAITADQQILENHTTTTQRPYHTTTTPRSIPSTSSSTSTTTPTSTSSTSTTVSQASTTTRPSTSSSTSSSTSGPTSTTVPSSASSSSPSSSSVRPLPTQPRPTGPVSSLPITATKTSGTRSLALLTLVGGILLVGIARRRPS